MPYRDAASGIASLGRYGDDTLVHMNRDEVQGLQSLAMAQGGSLSINPYTGLPEAFSLKKAFKKFLPTIVGGALAATGFGAPAAALGGGLAGAATSKGNLLEGFAMGALGGFGGAGLAQGLGFAGANAANAASASGAGAAAEGAAAGAGGAGGAGAGGAGGAGAGADKIVSNAINPPPTIPNAYSGPSAALPPAPPSPSLPTGTGLPPPSSGGLSITPPPPPPPVSTPTAPPPGPTSMGGKFNQFAEGFVDKYIPPGAQEKIRNPKLMASGIATLMSGASREEVPKMKKGPLYRQYDFDSKTGRFTAKEPSNTWKDPYAPGYAEGGALNNITAQNNYLANLSRGGSADMDINSFTGEPRYAQGGMSPELGGRFLKGPGDGVSDSIPAEIPTEQGPAPAKLAAGEFVIPARIVAELGNGSSDAGAKQLYAMMDRIEARMKKSKRGKDSGARKELVA